MMRAAIMRDIWRRIRESLEESLRQQAWDYQAQAEAASGKLQDKLTTALQKLDAVFVATFHLSFISGRLKDVGNLHHWV